jgi:histidinol-phosphate/aromatic aminotransferase/cobyric acid decarboxylase-like protein
MLNSKEDEFYQVFQQLKEEAGNHSPSIFRLLKSFPEVSIKIDACFLCNPYAFNLFYERFADADLQNYIKFYPPQNHEVAENIAAFRDIPATQILIGNGAIELIEQFVQGSRVVFPLPTFSPYYEQLEGVAELLPFMLLPEDGFALDIDAYLAWINQVNPDLVILVNPNNPTGNLVQRSEVIRLHQSLRKDQRLLVDESFIDFASEDHSIEKYALDYDNIIIIRSLSKDFGIAGLRLGYAVLPAAAVQASLKRGFLWNSNGIAYYFTELLADPAFQKRYAKAKKDYNSARDDFYRELVKIGLDVVPSQANFFMIKTPGDPGAYFTKLLYTHGIYTRILNDKWGLEGNWLRIASKDRKENRQMLLAIKKIWKG